ncbi:hypothetical protein PUN28_008101 [Cardiocondyla obscurior]|uniref:Uncharacterized protein n=1 Tax=Cardiocondyla obscurior TaxID=286306 RepID=A0AAW2FY90_9HYME
MPCEICAREKPVAPRKFINFPRALRNRSRLNNNADSTGRADRLIIPGRETVSNGAIYDTRRAVDENERRDSHDIWLRPPGRPGREMPI